MAMTKCDASNHADATGVDRLIEFAAPRFGTLKGVFEITMAHTEKTGENSFLEQVFQGDFIDFTKQSTIYEESRRCVGINDQILA